MKLISGISNEIGVFFLRVGYFITAHKWVSRQAVVITIPSEDKGLR